MIIRIPGSDSLVMVYNRYREEQRRREAAVRSEKRGYAAEPLAVIPEPNIELYSRCIVCRMNEEGELESLERGDEEKVLKYLAR